MAYSKYNTARFRGDIPVKEGETYDIEIEGTGEKGDGIGKIKGYVVIVPGAKKGDNLKVKITAVRGRVSFGEIAEKGEKPAEKEPEEEPGEYEGDLEDDTDDKEGEIEEE